MVKEATKASTARATGDGDIPPFAGDFGPFGGRYVAETLMPAVEELARAWPEAWADPKFLLEYHAILRDYVGRPSALSEAPRLSAQLREQTGVDVQVTLKREDLRWPIPVDAVRALRKRTCVRTSRRSKYLNLHFDGRDEPIAMIHLGMSGRLWIDPKEKRAPTWRDHEHSSPPVVCEGRGVPR